MDRPERTVVPVPDPSTLTTEAMHREIASLKELLTTQIAAIRVDLKHDFEQVQVIIRGIYDEKFIGITTQLRERDARVEQSARTADAALQAALQAAKEAVGKQTEFFTTTISELKQAVTKQLDSLKVLIDTVSASLDAKINEVKDRVGIIEGTDRGQRGAIHDRQSATFNVANVIGMIGGIIGAVAIIVTLFITSHAK